MFGSFGLMELVLILIIVLIIFGAGKLPQLGEGLGKAIKGFKKSVDETQAPETPTAASMQERTQPSTHLDPVAIGSANDAQAPQDGQSGGPSRANQAPGSAADG